MPASFPSLRPLMAWQFLLPCASTARSRQGVAYPDSCISNAVACCCNCIASIELRSFSELPILTASPAFVSPPLKVDLYCERAQPASWPAARTPRAVRAGRKPGLHAGCQQRWQRRRLGGGGRCFGHAGCTGGALPPGLLPAVLRGGGLALAGAWGWVVSVLAWLGAAAYTRCERLQGLGCKGAAFYRCITACFIAPAFPCSHRCCSRCSGALRQPASRRGRSRRRWARWGPAPCWLLPGSLGTQSDMLSPTCTLLACKIASTGQAPLVCLPCWCACLAAHTRGAPPPCGSRLPRCLPLPAFWATSSHLNGRRWGARQPRWADDAGGDTRLLALRAQSVLSTTASCLVRHCVVNLLSLSARPCVSCPRRLPLTDGTGPPWPRPSSPAALPSAGSSLPRSPPRAACCERRLCVCWPALQVHKL